MMMLSMHTDVRCFICNDPHPVVNHPYQPFLDPVFGTTTIQEFMLCERCEGHFQSGHMALLTETLILSAVLHEREIPSLNRTALFTLLDGLRTAAWIKCQ